MPPLAILLLLAAPAAAQPPASTELLLNATGANDTFAAVGRLRAASACTGTLIDPSGAAADNSKAWLLSAGHCLSLEPYAVIRNQPLNAEVIFDYFADTPDRRLSVRTRSIGWSTMKGVDVSLVELDATLGELRARGVRPLRLASTPPAAGRPVFWTGIPQTPIPIDLQFLRRGSCTLGPRVDLLEGNWIWNNELSNDCPDLYGGASGSPLFDSASDEIVGVIGTGTLLNVDEGPDYDCQANHPCVVRAGIPVMQRDTSYASPIEGLARCFDSANTLDVRLAGCPLDPGLQLTIQSAPNEVRPVVDAKPALWDAALTGALRYYSYKHGPTGAGDCADPAGYGPVLSLAAAPMIHDPVGAADGYYFLCVIAGDSPVIDASWQQPSHASMRFKRLDTLPPQVTVDYELEPIVGAYRLEPVGSGALGLGPAFSKRGPLPSTDCADPAGYRIQLSIPDTVRPSDYPLRICWKTSDRAGNLAQPLSFDFGPPAILPNAVRNPASLQRGVAAPASIVLVDTFQLTNASGASTTPVESLAGVRMSLQDSSGRVFSVPLTRAGPLYQEGVLPDGAATGAATIVILPPSGAPVSQSFQLAAAVPGLYYDLGNGIARGYASDTAGNVFPFGTCPAGQSCYLTKLPLSSTVGGLDFTFYGTGIRNAAGRVRLRIGTHTLDAVEVAPHAGIAGMDDIHFHLPSDFPLRLLQLVSVETPDKTSNHLWIYLD